MHYSWSTEARARRALANVSALLRPGGIFIGTMPDANVIIKKLREGFFRAVYIEADMNKLKGLVFVIISILHFPLPLTHNTKNTYV